MKIITPQEAAALGLKTYYTGKPCKHGHVTERYLGSGACKGCVTQVRTDRQRNYIKKLQGDIPFTYLLDPADRAAAWAFCVALDLARGRTPPGTPPVQLNVVKEFDVKEAWTRIHGPVLAQRLWDEREVERARG